MQTSEGLGAVERYQRQQTALRIAWGEGGGGGFRRGEAGVCGGCFLFCFTSTINRQSRPGVIAPGLWGLLWFWITAAVDVSSDARSTNETVGSHSRDGGQPPPLPTTVNQSLPIVFSPLGRPGDRGCMDGTYGGVRGQITADNLSSLTLSVRPVDEGTL